MRYVCFPMAVLVLTAAAPLFAQVANPDSVSPPGPPPVTGGPPAIQLPTGSAYSALIQKGNALVKARNYPAAIEAYRAAAAADGRDAVALAFLGEAEVLAGDLLEADAAFSNALNVAKPSDDVRARVLFATADLRERQGKWLDAKGAWEAYAQFLSAHTALKGHPATAAERGKAIATRVEVEAKASAVKQRAEQRAKEAPPAASSPSSTPNKK